MCQYLCFNNLKAQSSFEFMILVSLAILFFTVFFIAINQDVAEKTEDNRRRQMEEILLNVKNEIQIASESVNGYSREFSIPTKIGPYNYEIIINDGLLYAETEGKEYGMAISVQDVSGEIFSGKNLIQKREGEVFLNS
jgi:hypothetical protein